MITTVQRLTANTMARTKKPSTVDLQRHTLESQSLVFYPPAALDGIWIQRYVSQRQIDGYAARYPNL